MSRYGTPRASLPPRSDREALLPPAEPAPEQRCFPYDAPDIPDLPPGISRSRLCLTADISESASAVVRCLDRIGVQVLRRPVQANYVVGSVGIARKTVAEIARSVRDGTLATETMMLARAFRHRLLVCEGSLDAHNAWCRVWGALVQAAVKAAVPVLLTSGPMDTARLITWIGAAVTSRRPKRPPMFGQNKNGAGTAARQIDLLAALPNVGQDLARRILARYGHVRGASAGRSMGRQPGEVYQETARQA